MALPLREPPWKAGRLTVVKQILLVLVVTVTLTGCARPGDHPISENCSWIEDDSRALNLQSLSDRRHLRFDATTAEDVAIRWADKHYSHLPEWDRRCDECMSTLLSGLATHHHVDVAVVSEYRLARDLIADSAVILAFVVVYAFVAYYIAGRIRRRFPAEEPGFWVMTVTMSLGIGLVAVLVGGLWSIVFETFRLNTAHLSYRMNRIPLRQHWVMLFLGSVLLFAIAAVIRSRVDARGTDQPYRSFL